MEPTTGYASIGDQRVAHSDIRFEDRSVHELKGFDGQWQLYSVMRGTG